MTITRRVRWSFTLALVAALTALSGGQALAECVQQVNRWPAFTDVAPTAKRIVVGTVIEGIDQFDAGQHVAYRLRVEEVLRGSAPEVIEVRALRSRLPRRGTSACRADSYLSAKVGDVIAIAYRGKLPGVPTRVNTAAWIEGRPHVKFSPGAERLTLGKVRRLAGHAWDGSTLPPDRGVTLAPPTPKVTLAAAINALVLNIEFMLSDFAAWMASQDE